MNEISGFAEAAKSRKAIIYYMLCCPQLRRLLSFFGKSLKFKKQSVSHVT